MQSGAKPFLLFTEKYRESAMEIIHHAPDYEEEHAEVFDIDKMAYIVNLYYTNANLKAVYLDLIKKHDLIRDENNCDDPTKKTPEEALDAKFRLYKRYLSMYDRESGCALAKYHHSRSKYRGQIYARLFADGSNSFQNHDRLIRHVMMDEHYADIDVKNCHPTILSYLCHLNGIQCPMLDYYVANKDAIISELETAQQGKKMPMNGKQLFISIIYGGVSGFKKTPVKTKFLIDFCKEVRMILGVICKMMPADYDIHRKNKLAQHKPCFAMEGSFVSNLVSEIENIILHHVMDFYGLLENGSDTVLCFDGLMLPKTIDPQLDELREYVKCQTGIDLTFTVKPMAFAHALDEWLPTEIPEVKIENGEDASYLEHYQDDVCDNGEIGLAQIFINEVREQNLGFIIIDNSSDGGEKKKYIYNEKTCLWEVATASMTMKFIFSVLSPILEKCISIIARHIHEYRNELSKYSGPAPEGQEMEWANEERELKASLKEEEGALEQFNKARITISKVAGARAIKAMLDLNDMSRGVKESVFNKCVNKFPIANNRCIDLISGHVIDRVKEDYFTFASEIAVEDQDIANFNFEGSIVDSVISPICCGNRDIIEYLQCVLGSTLSGDLTRSIYILFGEGKNGKSVLANIMSSILGPYFTPLPKSVFTSRETMQSDNAHSSHLIPLASARFGILNELNENEKLTSDLLKKISGGDVITVREIREKQTQMQSQAKLFLSTNELPKFDIYDRALLDRLVIIPLNARFVLHPKEYKDGDTIHEYPEKRLFSETQFYKDEKQMKQFLLWLVHGARKFYAFEERHIPTPQILDNYMSELVNDLDCIKLFIDERLEVTSEYNFVESARLYSAFVEYWCALTGKDSKLCEYTHQKFSKVINKYISLVPAKERHGIRGYSNVMLKN